MSTLGFTTRPQLTMPGGIVVELGLNGPIVISSTTAPPPRQEDPLQKLRDWRTKECDFVRPLTRFFVGDIINAGTCEHFNEMDFADRPWLAIVTAVDRDDRGADLYIKWFDSKGAEQDSGWFDSTGATLVEPYLPAGSTPEPVAEEPAWARPR